MSPPLPFIHHIPCPGWAPSCRPVGAGQTEAPGHPLCMGVMPVPPLQVPTYDPCGISLLAPSPFQQCPSFRCLARFVSCSSFPVWHSRGRHRLCGQTAEAVSLRLPQGKHRDLLSPSPPPSCRFGAAPGLRVALPGLSVAGGKSSVRPAFFQSIWDWCSWKQGSRCPPGCC